MRTRYAMYISNDSKSISNMKKIKVFSLKEENIKQEKSNMKEGVKENIFLILKLELSMNSNKEQREQNMKIRI